MVDLRHGQAVKAKVDLDSDVARIRAGDHPISGGGHRAKSISNPSRCHMASNKRFSRCALERTDTAIYHSVVGLNRARDCSFRYTARTSRGKQSQPEFTSGTRQCYRRSHGN